MNILLFLLLGLIVGILSGIVGLGGGIFVIPALVYLFGFSQKEAQGTTLAMLVPPIGILAAWIYYKQGFVNLKVAGLLCAGFFIGGLLGAQFAVGLPNDLLRRLFGVFLFFISIYMIFFK